MSKKASPTMIGAFTLAALAIAVVAILVLGSGKFMTEKVPCVMYFESSLSGLDVGAPVEFKGVKIGSITSISLVLNSDDGAVSTPVYAEILPQRLSVVGRERAEGEMSKILIARGMRAQLQSSSLLTGKLKVSFVERPGTEYQLQGDGAVPEIPTVKTTTEELAQMFSDLPINQTLERIADLVDIMAKAAESPETQQTMLALASGMQSASTLMASLSTSVPGAMTNMSSSFATLDAVLTESRPGISNLVRSLPEFVDGLDLTMDRVRISLEQIDHTLGELEEVMEAESPLQYEFRVAIRELSGALGSLTAFTDYMQQHPESLITGKKASGRK
jgi:paraquat-inducible protein B